MHAELDSPLRVVVRDDYKLLFFNGNKEVPFPWGPLHALNTFERYLQLNDKKEEKYTKKIFNKIHKYFSWVLGGGRRGPRQQQRGTSRGSGTAGGGGTHKEGTKGGAPNDDGGAPKTVAQAMQLLLTAPDLSFNPPLPLVYLHAAATALHPAAAAAVAWKKQYAALDGSVGQQQQA